MCGVGGGGGGDEWRMNGEQSWYCRIWLLRAYSYRIDREVFIKKIENSVYDLYPAIIGLAMKLDYMKICSGKNTPIYGITVRIA